LATIGLLPPSFKLKPLAHATASTQVAVSAPTSLSSFNYPDLYNRNLVPRSAALADMSASPLVRGYIARAAGLPASEIAVDPPLWDQLQRIQQWATGEKRANQIIAESDPYRITLNNDLYAPIINVVTQAPTADAATRLAMGAEQGLSAYVSSVEAAAGTAPGRRVRVSQLAPITVSPAHKSGLASVAMFTFVGVFVLWCGLLLLIASVRRDVRALGVGSKVRGAFDRSSDKRRWPGPTRATS
jgi:hypothetical protein